MRENFAKANSKTKLLRTYTLLDAKNFWIAYNSPHWQSPKCYFKKVQKKKAGTGNIPASFQNQLFEFFATRSFLI